MTVPFYEESRRLSAELHQAMERRDRLEAAKARLWNEAKSALAANAFARHRTLLDAYSATSAECLAAENLRSELDRRHREACREAMASYAINGYLFDVRTAVRNGLPAPPMPEGVAVDRLLRAASGAGLGNCEAFRRHVERLCRENGITARLTVIGHHQGLAFTKTRIIEGPSIESIFDYATWLHEIAHQLHPCEPAHVRATNGDSTGTLCVRCEFIAWHTAIDLALEWDSLAHQSLSLALRSYRRFATPAEQEEIDTMCGPHGYRLARLQRANRGAVATETRR